MLSKIKQVSATGRTWTNKKDGSTMHVHSYEMEDGVVFQANHKTQMPFNVGDEVDYTITKDDEQYGKSGTVKKPEQANFNSGGAKSFNDGIDPMFKQRMIVRQNALGHATAICIHNAKALATAPGEQAVNEIDVINMAELFEKWVMAEEKKAEPFTPNAVEGVAQEVADKMQG